MKKTYWVLNLNKANYNPTTGKITGFQNGAALNGSLYDGLPAAQAQADAVARTGMVAVIFEARELRQIKPSPIIVERVECNDSE